MELFYAEPGQIDNQLITLDDFEKKHLLQTLRKQPGEQINITDGQGKLYHCLIIKNKKEIVAEIQSVEQKPEPHLNLSLGLGFIRPARLEMILEKGTELGVTRFYLFKSEFANYHSDNVKRYQKILRQAVKQSLRFYLPRIILTDAFPQFVGTTKSCKCKFAAIDAGQPALISQLRRQGLNSGDEVLLTIGPEGGFSDAERMMMHESNFIPVSLGINRLRSETAAISGLAVVQSFFYYQKEEGFAE